MIPPEEGIWGNRGSPIVLIGQVFVNASASVEWADFVSASKLVFVRASGGSTS